MGPYIEDIQLAYPDYRSAVEKQISNQFPWMPTSFQNKVQQKLGLNTKNTAYYPTEYIYGIGSATLQTRMRYYREQVFHLGSKVLDNLMARHDPASFTHFLFVSCTGITAPTFADLFAQAYNMSPKLKTQNLNFMGCSAGVKAIQLAHDLCCNKDYNAKVLILSVEVCTIHLSMSIRMPKSDIIGQLLFADGCAGMVVSSACDNPMLEILKCETVRAPSESTGYLTWDVGPKKFDMYIDKNIVNVVKAGIADVVKSLSNDQDPKQLHYSIHPGGPKILTTIKETLGLEMREIEPALEVFGDCGNTSSSTIFHVLENYLRNQDVTHDMCVMAFGPGMTFESALVRAVGPSSSLRARLQEIYANVEQPIMLPGKVLREFPWARSQRKPYLERMLTHRREKGVQQIYQAALSTRVRLETQLLKGSQIAGAIKTMKPAITTVCEVVGTRSRTQGPGFQSTASGLDAIRKSCPDITCYQADDGNEKAADVFLLTFATHSLRRNQAVDILSKLYVRSNSGLLIVDYQRNFLAYALWVMFGLIICWFNFVAYMDGIRNIERSFTPGEIRSILLDANIPPDNIRVLKTWPWIHSIAVCKREQ